MKRERPGKEGERGGQGGGEARGWWIRIPLVKGLPCSSEQAPSHDSWAGRGHWWAAPPSPSHRPCLTAGSPAAAWHWGAREPSSPTPRGSGTSESLPSLQPRQLPAATCLVPGRVTGHHHSDTGGRGSGAKPKAVWPGTLPRQLGSVGRGWALEPDCLGLNPSPTTCWLWGPDTHLSEPGAAHPQNTRSQWRAQGRCHVAHSGSLAKVSPCPPPQGVWCIPTLRGHSFKQLKLSNAFQCP